MGFSGSLDSISLADLLQNLNTNRASGVLTITDKKVSHHIRIRDGLIVDLARGKEGIGVPAQTLFVRDLATEVEVREVLSSRKDNGPSLSALLAGQVETPEDVLEQVLQSVLKDELCELFRIQGAGFEFDDGKLSPEKFALPDPGMPIAPSGLIMEAARRLDEWDRIKKVVPSMREVFIALVRPEDLPQELADEIHAMIISHMDATRDVDDLVEELHFGKFVTAQAVSELVGARLVQLATADFVRAGAERRAVDGEHEKAVKLYERLLALGGDSPETRKALAESAAQSGHDEKAAIHYTVLADALLEAGEYEETVEACTNVMKLLPRHAPSRERLAKSLLALGRRDEAARHFAALVRIHVDANRAVQARDAALEAIKLDPFNTEVRTNLAKVYVSLDEKALAAEQLESAGETYQRMRKNRAAVDAFKRALQLDPSRQRLRDRLDAILLRESAMRRRRLIRRLRFLFWGTALAVLVAGAAHEGYFYLMFRRALVASGELSVSSAPEKAAAPLQDYLRLRDKAVAELVPFREWTESEIGKCRVRQTERRLAASTARLASISELGEVLKEGTAAYERHDYAVARLFLKRILSSPLGAGDLKDRASTLISAMAEEDGFISEYEKWMESRRGERGASTIRAEFLRKTELLERYPNSAAAAAAKLPLRVTSVPEKADLFVNEKLAGTTPLIIHYAPSGTTKVRIRKDGYAACTVAFESREDPFLDVELKRAPEWDVRVPGRIVGDIVVIDERIFVGTKEGRVFRVSGRTGERGLAPFSVSDPFGGITSGLLSYEGHLLFGGGSSLYCVQVKEEGKMRERWSSAVGAQVASDLSVATIELLSRSAYLFVGLDSGQLLCMNVASGREQWRGSIVERPPVRSRPVVTQTRIFAGSDDGHFYAFDVVTGQVVLDWDLGALPVSSPTMVGDRIYVGNGSGKLYCLDRGDDTQVLWQFRARGRIVSAPAYSEGVLYFGTTAGLVYAVKATTGRLTWKAPFQCDGEVRVSPLVESGIVYMGTSTGEVVGVDVFEGTSKWRVRVGQAAITSRPAMAADLVIFGAADGKLYAFQEYE